MNPEGEQRAVIPQASGMRVEWERVPLSVRGAIEDYLGRRVVRTSTQLGGFSPGLAARLFLSDGQVVFAKAVGSSPNARSPNIHRREVKIAYSLPRLSQFPRFLWSFDDGDWVVLLFENINGAQPVVPWRQDELDRVLSGITMLSRSLTPSPIPTASVGELFQQSFQSWRNLAKQANAGGEEERILRSLDPWCQRNIDHLAELESGWEETAKGDTLVHADIRADNILMTRNEAIFVDWPWACLGSKWLDLLFFLPSVAMQGGPKPWNIFDSHPPGREADREGATRVLAALTGLFLYLGNKPPEPGLPNLREFQLGQGEVALEWLKRMTGWK